MAAVSIIQDGGWRRVRDPCSILRTLQRQELIHITNKAPFASKFDFEFEKLVKCYIWSITLYGAEDWTLQKVYPKYPKSF
jgi:hypothetical protein